MVCTVAVCAWCVWEGLGPSVVMGMRAKALPQLVARICARPPESPGPSAPTSAMEARLLCHCGLHIRRVSCWLGACWFGWLAIDWLVGWLAGPVVAIMVGSLVGSSVAWLACLLVVFAVLLRCRLAFVA